MCARARACAESEREGRQGGRESGVSAPGWRRHQEIGARYGTMASSHGRSDLRFVDWMASLPQSMHTIPLTNLAIPGRFLLGSPQRPCAFFLIFSSLNQMLMSEFSKHMEVFLSCRCVHKRFIVL